MKKFLKLKTTRNIEKIREGNSRRIFSIDITRALAVLFMIVTHVVAIVFSHKEGASQIAFLVGAFGGTISFTLFLLVSGSTSYFTTISLEANSRRNLRHRQLKSLKRTLQILLAYYVLAALSLFAYGLAFTTNTSEAIVTDILQIILLLRVPEFTEFLVTFVVFSLSLLLFRRVYKFLLKDYRILVIAGAISYFVGTILYQVDLGQDRLNLIKALFSGHGNVHTFPFLQYFPIFLTGLFIGKLLSQRAELSKAAFRKQLMMLLGLVGSLTIISVLLNFVIPDTLFGYSVFSHRFPPQIGFVLLSIALSLIVLFTVLRIETLFNRVRGLVTFISKNALSYFVIHTALLLVFKYYMDAQYAEVEWRFDRFMYVLFFYIGVLALTTLIIFVKEKIIGAYYVLDGYLNTDFYFVNIVLPFLLAFIVGATFFLVITDNRVVSGKDLNVNVNEVERGFVINSSAEKWYEDNFRYYQKVNVEDLTSDQIFLSQRWSKITLNHSAVVQENRLRKHSGEDIRVVEYDAITYKEVPIIIRDPNTDRTAVLFKYNPGDLQYFIYYGNDYSELSPAPQDQAGIDNAVDVNLGDKTQHAFEASTNKRWFLKDYPENPRLTFSVKVPVENKNVEYIIYKVENTDIQGEMTSADGLTYASDIDTTNLNPGYYTVEATAIELRDSINVYNTYKIPFYVSYPLYLTWTMDWEGWGVGAYESNDIFDISSKYGVPVTHFFNPRIFVKNQYSIYSVDPASAQYYVNLVNQRRGQGDAIGLHLHYYADLLEEVGVTKRPEAQIVGSNRDETSLDAYTQAENEKILQWSIDKFAEHGLPRPTMFRSGGWMTSIALLQALSNKGFVLDSSGRTGGVLNPAWTGSTIIPWNLSATTTPFLPSRNNINTWTGERLNIWEFPNNGADSYWFPLDELFSRFNQNYPTKGDVLSKPQVLTYLSHPHGFPVFDSTKIRGLFDYTGNFIFREDRGPVVYSTLETTYNNWNKVSFTDGD